jgi:hypothetical protein
LDATSILTMLIARSSLRTSQCWRSSGRGPRPHDALAARSHAGYRSYPPLCEPDQLSMTNSAPWAYAYADCPTPACETYSSRIRTGLRGRWRQWGVLLHGAVRTGAPASVQAVTQRIAAAGTCAVCSAVPGWSSATTPPTACSAWCQTTILRRPIRRWSATLRCGRRRRSGRASFSWWY